jgi:hypothetical protein
MIRRRMFVPVELVQDRRAKSDRIIQALAGLVAYGHLHIHSSMSKLMQQLDDFDSTTDQHDDVIDALAIAIMSMNPALRLSTNDGEIFEDDEDEYEELSFGGCP